jgi:hypothetical protein
MNVFRCDNAVTIFKKNISREKESPYIDLPVESE